MTVYADILFVVNYAVNLALLLISARLLGIIPKKKRICLAALLGAAGSLIIFLPLNGILIQNLYKIALTFVMTITAFGIHPYRRLIRALLALTLCSFLFAGVMLALQFVWGGILYESGVVYFDISAFELIFWTGAAYGILWLFERLFLGRKEEKNLCSVTADLEGKQISFHALEDNGNRLKEPFSGAPVVVCDGALAGRLSPASPERIRLIPCSTVTGDAVLEAFRPDCVRITYKGREIITKDVYIAKSKEPIRGEYEAVLNSQIID